MLMLHEQELSVSRSANNRAIFTKFLTNVTEMKITQTPHGLS